MKLLLPLVLAFSFVGQSAFATMHVMTCRSPVMTLVVNFKTGGVRFYDSKLNNLASDSVFNLTTYAVKSTQVPSVAYVVNFKKYGLLKAQIRNISFSGFAELDHERQFSPDETGDEEIVSFRCDLGN